MVHTRGKLAVFKDIENQNYKYTLNLGQCFRMLIEIWSLN